MFRAMLLAFTVSGLLGCGEPIAPVVAKIDPQISNTHLRGTNMPHPELAFFNSLTGRLEIELTVPPERIGNLENLAAKPDAKIKSLRLVAEVFNRESETFRKLSSEELRSVAFRESSITLRGESDEPVTHQAPNGKFFTVQDLLTSIAETERQTRDQSEWFDGVDVHHVFFEGIHEGSNGIWEIYWGS